MITPHVDDKGNLHINGHPVKWEGSRDVVGHRYYTAKVGFTPDHIVKRAWDERSARLEVSAGRFMRKLGIHEAPEHHYVQWNGRHHVVQSRIHGAEPLGARIHLVKHVPRLVDILGAEHYLGIGDRHDYNYLVKPDGGVHPIDYGQAFTESGYQGDMGQLHSALPVRLKALKVSPQLQATMRYHLPLLKIYDQYVSRVPEERRYDRIAEVLSRLKRPSLEDLT